MTNSCREKISMLDSIKLLKTSISSILDIITISGLLPVLFSCTYNEPAAETETVIKVDAIRNNVPADMSTVDILTFNDDELMHLDSYQRVTDMYDNNLSIRSQTGDKIIFVCTDCHNDKAWWGGVSSYPSLSRIYAEICQETRHSVLMCGKVHINTRDNTRHIISIAPIASRVILRSLRCDFSGTEYPHAEITEVRTYLINVNARSSLTEEDPSNPTSIINQGGLDYNDIGKLTDSSIVIEEIHENITNREINPYIEFLCYPNAGLNDGPGTPFTRLVIEGKIDGRTYWWPININRHEGCTEQGIYRNRCYIYDIVICSKGTDDPDTPIIGSKQAEIRMSNKPWNEKEEYCVGF